MTLSPRLLRTSAALVIVGMAALVLACSTDSGASAAASVPAAQSIAIAD